ncbi:hypothetical protein OsJ_27890 [Oryza sativa Japonica Group]|uniref:Uncharacterized protein n=1 Tax=Oryza sativa subsp. japonica TaxID=39947 RepID=A3BUQ5_ORYSJ|nr:hypothetical protein OsJ_27890 [Oryza sativa Japonica Group]
MAPSNQLLFLGLWHHMLRHWPCLSSLNVKVPIPSALGDLPLLQTIQLEAMAGMYGPIPSSFAKLCHLQFLFISGTSISGSIPDFLVKTNLSALSITNSKLNGSIPESLSLLPNLRVIDLSGNMLTGSIPPGLFHGGPVQIVAKINLTKILTKCSLERYQMTMAMETLTPLISHTTSSSVINPLFLFDIAKPMAKIDLSWNRLEFDMTKVRFPHHLNYLDLSHNSIKGRVAKSLKDINLKFCNVSYNELCGEIPTGRYMAYHGADCYVHNKCLCGSPLPPCKNGQ